MTTDPTRGPWPAPKPVRPWDPPKLTGSGYPAGYLERLRASGTWPAPKPSRNAIIPGATITSRYGSLDPLQVVEVNDNLVTYVRNGERFTMYPEHAELAPRTKRAKRKLKRKLKRELGPSRLVSRVKNNRRKLLAFGTSLLGYDITKLMDPPKRGGKAHSAKCRAGRKGAKGGPGFIRTDPRCPACKAQKRGKR